MFRYLLISTLQRYTFISKYLKMMSKLSFFKIIATAVIKDYQIYFFP